MTDKFELSLIGCIIVLVVSVSLLASSINKLQGQIDRLNQRNEAITQQLQEMNRYVRYPGGRGMKEEIEWFKENVINGHCSCGG